VSTQPPSAAPVENQNREQQQNEANKNPQNSLPDSQDRPEPASINSFKGPVRTTWSNPSNSPTDQNADRRGAQRPTNNAQNASPQRAPQSSKDQRVGDQNSQNPPISHLTNSPNQGSAQRNPNPYYSNSNTKKPSSSEEQNSRSNTRRPTKGIQPTTNFPNNYGNLNSFNQHVGPPNGFNGIGAASNGIGNPNRYPAGTTNQNGPYNSHQGSHEVEGPPVAFKPTNNAYHQNSVAEEFKNLKNSLPNPSNESSGVKYPL
jgi:hypothetical protein